MPASNRTPSAASARCGHSCYPTGPPGGSYICGREQGHEGRHRSTYGDGCEWDETHCWIGRTDSAATTDPRDVCETCDGDGYTEAWNADQTDVVITLCTDCGPGPGDFDA